jgi:PAS domain S-box-containing protein
MDNGIIILAADGECLYANQYGGHQLGVPPDQLMGKKITDVFPEDTAKHQMELVNAVIANDRDIVTEELTVSQNEPQWVRIRVQPLHDPDGKPVQAIVNVVDITDNKHAHSRPEESSQAQEQHATQRDKTDTALCTNQDQVQSSAETNDKVFWISKPQQKQVVYLSPGHNTIWGHTIPSFPIKPNAFLAAIHPDDIARVRADFGPSSTHQAFSHEFRVRRPDGTLRWLWNRGLPIVSETKHVELYAGVAQDISACKQVLLAQDQVPFVKETLLEQVHQRVKKDLQLISGLLSTQFDAAETDPITFVLNRRNRIESMALIYEKLCCATDLAHIDFRAYLDDLTTRLYGIHRPKGGVSLEKCVPEVYFNLDTAIPLGLIVNELISNSFKYAFPRTNGLSHWIQLSLRAQDDGKYVLTIGDNGVGLPQDVDLGKPTSLGLQLVMILVAELRGTLELCHDHGTEYQITFREMHDKPC